MIEPTAIAASSAAANLPTTTPFLLLVLGNATPMWRPPPGSDMIDSQL